MAFTMEYCFLQRNGQGEVGCGLRLPVSCQSKCQNTIKQLKMGSIYTVGGGTALCKQSYVTLCCYIQGIKLFGTNSRFLFSQYNLNSIQKNVFKGSSSVNTVCAVGLDVLKPSFIATVHKSCCCVHTLLYFSQKVRQYYISFAFSGESGPSSWSHALCVAGQ